MLFNSYIFILVFLPITLLGYYRIGSHGHHSIAIAWLVIASLFFYGWWNPAYLGLILFSILVNYGFGVSLSRERTSTSAVRRITLTAGIVINLGMLCYFKYANFFVDSANFTFGTDWHLDKIILPLAISFFTFQQVAYLVDAYRGEAREYNFLHYCLFVTFFPQLIAGPIVHHKEMLPQFVRNVARRLSHLDFSIGLTIFVIGLFKKVVIADSMALLATPVFQAAEVGQSLDFLTAWTGVFAYTIQLYFDFSGYSDMAIGLARMFGIKLPLNFNSPYQAVNIIDFWRRWHITLSRFLRDYLYIPLGGNRKGPARRQVNLMLTMLLGGLWHGAGWNFVIWGGLHGIYLVINHLWQQIWRKSVNTWWSRSIARCLTLLAVMVSWVFFRAESLDGALTILQGMANLPTTLHGHLGPLEDWLSMIGIHFQGGYLGSDHYIAAGWLVFWLAVIWAWPNTQQWMARMHPALDDHVKQQSQPLGWLWQHVLWQPTRSWALITAAVGIVAMLGLSRISEFLYFQF